MLYGVTEEERRQLGGFSKDSQAFAQLLHALLRRRFGKNTANFADSLSPVKANSHRYESCEQMGPDSIDQWRSLIVVSGSPYRIETKEFAERVREFNQLQPFNFKSPPFDIFSKLFEVHISIYAAHLYDSAIL